jgi:hypothetical protein
MNGLEQAFIYGAGPLIIALLSYLTVLVNRQKDKVEEVHTIVNSQRTHMEARVDQLQAAMVQAGIVVPPAPIDKGKT